ncbi:MAG: ankyrin repeat domain-containing protein, partial [Verrucomicrobium sp.]
MGNSSASPVNSPPRGQPQTVEGILGQLGMAEEQAKALASSKHGITLKALFIGPQAPVGIVSAPGSPVSFRRLAASPLPANMGSLAQALAKVASRECATLLAVLLPCATAVNDTQAKIKIASACATAWSAAGLPTPALVLGDVENSAFQGELRKLLLQQDIAVELKLPLKPLLQLGYTRQDALDRLARVPQPGSTSSSPPLQPLKTLFYEALIHDDREVLDKVLAKFSRWPEKEMRESYNQCCADWVTCTAPPATAPQEGGASLMQDMMLMSPVSQNSLRVQELNAKGPQAMADAIAAGSAEKVKGLLEGGGKFLLNEPLPPMGWTALTLAASLGKKDVVEHLLNCDGIEVNACCPYPPEPTDKVNATVYPTSTQDATPLFMAAMNGHEDVVKLLLEKAEVDINQVNVSDSTPCDIAALNGHMGIFKLLLYRQETDVNRQDPINERTLLYRASSAGLHNVVEELLKHPDISVNLPEFSGASPLLAASRYCHLPVMRLLLADPRVDASVAGKYGQTPLHHVAAHHHQPEAIDLFLNLPLEKKKMLANKVDDWGRTPFSVAIQCGCDEEKFVEPLRKLTALTEVPSVGQVSTKHSQALMVVGSGIALPKASLQTVAAEGKVTLSYLGDGAKDISWKALTQLPDQDGAVGTVYCHGEWNEVSQTHMLVFGEQEGVPTCEALWIMYEKGFRKITVHACKSAHAAAGLARLINRDPRLP